MYTKPDEDFSAHAVSNARAGWRMTVRWRLACSSALMLFLELSLIRWLGANIVHLAYFSNFVLLGSFLGIGLGFLRASTQRPNVPPLYSLVALLGLLAFVSAYPVTINRSSSQVLYFTSLSTGGPPIWVTLPAVFLAVAAVMAGPGEMVARCFSRLPRLEAYRLDLLGSLAGIVAFTTLSFVGAPPLVWFGLVCASFVGLLGRAGIAVSVVAAVAVVALMAYPLLHDHSVFWSPYYKVSADATPDGNGGTAWTLSVNGIPHQRLTSAATRDIQEPWYQQTYQQLSGTPRNVLIIGAGTGTDVAIALQHGAQHVDAVEIDPTLLRFGRQHDPDHVYSDPRVSTHVNDGRAFLQETRSRYDLIIFALPDSLTLVSGASSLRLESYLFTEQAIQVARAHLSPGGAFSMYNFYRDQWLVDRYAGTLDDAFGHPPCVYDEPQSAALAVLTVGLTSSDQSCATLWQRTAATPPPATDDHPFPYLERPGVPSLYRMALLGILVISLLATGLVLRTSRSTRVRGSTALRSFGLHDLWSYRDLFLLGAAFLLLETKAVTGFALLFGTTWFVNALVFAGVLIAVLIAVELTNAVRTPPVAFLYALLIAALALNWLTPTSWLLSLGVIPRAALAITIAFLPIFAANMIFAKRFADTADGPLAFGVNLLGAIFGGCLEYLSLALGDRALLVIAGVLYIASYVITPPQQRVRRSVATGVAGDRPAPSATG